jgi:hypothetical protein
MTTILPSETSLLPPALLQRVWDVAALEHRHASEVLRDAIENYVRDRHGSGPLAPQTHAPQPPLTPDEIVALVFELRKGNELPEGETMKDLIEFGRA